MLVAGPAAAQGFAIVGDVVHGGGPRRTLAGRQAVLHRVTAEGGAAIDSTLTDRTGRYRFRLAGIDTGAVYLVSTEWHGIGYFTAPVRTLGRPVDTLETLVVYDTSSAGPPIRLVRRLVTLVRSDEPDHGVDVLEGYAVENPGTTARVARDTTRPVWSVALPTAAIQFQAGESDVSPEAIVRRGDSAAVFGTIAPGAIRQIMVVYALPRGTRQVTIPIDQWTGEVNLLVEDAAPDAAAGLTAMGPQDVEGRTFQRFRGGPLESGTAITVTLPRPPRGAQSFLPIAVGALVVVFGAGMFVALRARRSEATSA